MKLHHPSGELHFPTKNHSPPGARYTVDSNVNFIDQGMDPKPLVLDYCKP